MVVTAVAIVAELLPRLPGRPLRQVARVEDLAGPWGKAPTTFASKVRGSRSMSRYLAVWQARADRRVL